MIAISVKRVVLCILLLAGAASARPTVAADYYQVRDGIPNSQYFFKLNRVGNQYLFFIGDSVLAGTGLKDANLRYSRQMVERFAKFFPEASIHETRHMHPGGSWFGLFRCSRGQAVFGEVICSGHLAILDFAAGDRNSEIDEVKLALEGVVRQITHYRATHSRILVYYGIPSLNLAKYAAGRILSGQITFEDFSADGINPTDAGAKIYAEAVAAFVDDVMTAFPIPEKPCQYTLPAPLFPETNDNGQIVAYENPRPCQALIAAGHATGDNAALALGLEMLDWLAGIQRSPAGRFAPIGCRGFYPRGGDPATFDQQPIEAQAMIAACAAAFHATGDQIWIDRGWNAFDWFRGHNVLGVGLCDPRTGGCRDGLLADRANENQGAESTLAYLTAVVDMRLLEARAAASLPPRRDRLPCT